MSATLTNPIKSIALFAPNRVAAYMNMLLGLRKAFVQRGIDVHVGWSYFDAHQMAHFCDVFKPDAILEIDRTRDNAPNMPRDVLSIAWIQDWRSMGEDKIGSSTDCFGGSDYYYFCVKPEAVGVDSSKLKNWGFLLQATDPDIYFAEEVAIKSDFSLIGYIPERRHLDKLDNRLGVELIGPPMNMRNYGTIRQLIEALKAEGLSWNTYDIAKARDAINRYVYSLLDKSGTLLGKMVSHFGPLGVFSLNQSRCVVPDDMMYLIENEIMRALGRTEVVNAALAASTSMRLFGLGMWQTYPEYAKYYQGPVLTETEVRRIYRSTRLNLHNAMTQMHSRTLDCMASGSVIMVNKMLHNDADQPDCLRAHFESGVHYFEYDDDLTESARKLLADEERRRMVGRSAAEAVRARHTWAHRVDQILSDLSRL